ncbi:MAG: PEP-CTERM sorting domain-containing protein [Planctomycetota bacterium]
MQLKTTLTGVAVVLSPALASAITIDGSLDAAYGPAVAVQTVNTSFGNATSPSGLGGGGEVDAAYATIEDGRLNVLITGNIENNFNKLNVFFDSRPGGENTLSSTPVYDFESLSQNFGGLTFDPGFNADFHLYARWGSFTGSVFTVDLVDRAGGTSAAVNGNGAQSSSGAGTGVQSGTITPGDLGLGPGPGNVGEVRNLDGFLTQPVEFGFNNTNTAGVTAGTGAANPAAALAVTTGFEFSIDLADLGSPAPGEEIKLHVAYGNGDQNFHSNQVLAGLPAGSGSLGGDGSGNFTGTLSGVDFNDFAGDQFFTLIVPGEPALIGDFSGDGFVGQDDLNLVLLNFGDAVLPVGFDPAGLDPQTSPDGFDGLIGQNELNDVLLNFGNGSLPADVAAVPEPATAALLAAGLLALRRRSA